MMRWETCVVVVLQRVLVGCILTLLAGCSLSDLVNSKALPTDILDPEIVKTPEGARGAYYSAVLAFRMSFASAGGYVESSGLLTDELQAASAIRVNGSPFPEIGVTGVDARMNGELGKRAEDVYKQLQVIRAKTREAAGALRQYDPTASPALIGHMLAIEGMAEVLLAELFCSGIPLSTLDFEQEYTLQPGSSTEKVFRHALTLFDSAALVAGDSTNLVHFVALGRARALLGIHDVVGAAQAVTDVPTTYRYMLLMEGEYLQRPVLNVFATERGAWGLSVGDRDGEVGLPFRSSGDPRTVSDSLPGGEWVPRKYRDPGAADPGANPGKAPVAFASGIEARLIEAEAALLAGNERWLTILNALRTSCLKGEGCPIPAPAGMGGIANLPLLEDPEVDLLGAEPVSDARLDLLFEERAYWLFLTGRRQADLRRLITQYGRDQRTVYPSGFWGRQKLASYGERISVPVPNLERERNPLYRGCDDV